MVPEADAAGPKDRAAKEASQAAADWFSRN
jgi:hypothetical protein